MLTVLFSREDRNTALPRASSLFREYGIVVAGVGATRLLTLVSTILLARKMSVEEFGIFSIGYALAMLVGQLPTVVDTAFIPGYAATGEEAVRLPLERAHLDLKMAAAALIALCAVLFSRPVASYAYGNPELSRVVFYALLTGALFGLFTTPLARYRARDEFVRYSSLYFAQGLFSLLAVVIYIGVLRPTGVGGVITYTVAYGVFGLAPVVHLRLQLSGPVGRPLKTHYVSMLRFTGWLVPASVLYIILTRVDILLLARYVDLHSLGIYGAGVRLLGVVSLFTGNIVTILLPRASRALGSPPGVRGYLLESALISTGIAILVLAGLVWTPELIRLTMGPNYVGGTSALRALLVAYPFIGISAALNCLVYAAKKTELVFLQRVIELGTAITAGLILIPRVGIVGAGIALAAAYGLGCLFMMLTVSHLLRSGHLGR